jgi:hypothetical protein
MARTRNRQDQSTVAVTAAMPAPLICLGYQQVTGLIGAASLAVPPGASYALMVAEGATLRWRDDGVAPTALVGMPLSVGGELRYDGDLAAFQVIQLGLGGILNVSYYG